mmetsp:Transcript_74619/g.235849  ORF Transcript_74619/g.235849 Transcript_74619/m.235849 type:complete len:315 (-) Transcript_74619:260-1204(-)
MKGWGPAAVFAASACLHACLAAPSLRPAPDRRRHDALPPAVSAPPTSAPELAPAGVVAPPSAGATAKGQATTDAAVPRLDTLREVDDGSEALAPAGGALAGACAGTAGTRLPQAPLPLLLEPPLALCLLTLSLETRLLLLAAPALPLSLLDAKAELLVNGTPPAFSLRPPLPQGPLCVFTFPLPLPVLELLLLPLRRGLPLLPSAVTPVERHPELVAWKKAGALGRRHAFRPVEVGQRSLLIGRFRRTAARLGMVPWLPRHVLSDGGVREGPGRPTLGHGTSRSEPPRPRAGLPLASRVQGGPHLAAAAATAPG